MLTRLLDDLKAAPERIRTAPTRMADRRRNTTRWARQRVRSARGQTQRQLWSLRVQTLERTGDLLDKGSDVPVIGRIIGPAASFVHSQKSALTAVPVDGFDAMNARDAIAAIKELDALSLFIAERFEAAHKNRKTVMAAIEREVERRSAE